MTWLVDTSVWSLALRRDQPPDQPEVTALKDALSRGESILFTGLILQELLQGFAGPTARAAIIDRFASLPMLNPDRQDHVDAAELRNRCRRRGIQIGTIDALIAQLALRHELTVLTTDRDFQNMQRVCKLRLWKFAT